MSSRHFSDNGDILTWWGAWLVRWSLVKYEARKRRDAFLIKVTGWIPKRLRYWVLVDSVAKATTGRWSGTHPDDLTWGDVLKRGVEDGSLVDPMSPMRGFWRR